MYYILADKQWFGDEFKTDGYYGGQNEKYAGVMHYSALSCGAKRFATEEEATKCAEQLNKNGSGYNFVAECVYEEEE